MMLDLLTTGYPSLDYIYNVSRSPKEDETAILTSFFPKGTYGGCGLNVAAALAKLGYAIGTAAVLGDDPDGMEYTEYLQSLGVSTDNVICLPNSGTSRTYVFVNPAGSYQLFFYPGAAGEWQPPLDLKGLENTRACLITVGPANYNQVFLEQALAANVPLYWQLKADVQAYPPDKLERLARAAKLLFMNDAECAYLLGVLGAAKLEDIMDDEQTAVLTSGGEGSTVCTRAGLTHVPAVPPARFIDSTGAGDGFTAGYLAGHFKGLSPPVCARLGAVLASYVIEAFGCQTNLPDWAQLTERYQSFFQSPLE
jgi:nucleoside kinase